MNCVISDWAAGVNLYRSEKGTISDNRFERNSTDITLNNSPGSIITRNEIKGMKQGIMARSSDGTTISSNTLSGIPSDEWYTTYSLGGITVNFYGSKSRLGFIRVMHAWERTTPIFSPLERVTRHFVP